MLKGERRGEQGEGTLVKVVVADGKITEIEEWRR